MYCMTTNLNNSRSPPFSGLGLWLAWPPCSSPGQNLQHLQGHGHLAECGQPQCGGYTQQGETERWEDAVGMEQIPPDSRGCSQALLRTPLPLRLQLFSVFVSVMTFPPSETLTFRVECLCVRVCLFGLGCAGRGLGKRELGCKARHSSWLLRFIYPFTLNNAIKTELTNIFLLSPKLTCIKLYSCGKPHSSGS